MTTPVGHQVDHDQSVQGAGPDLIVIEPSKGLTGIGFKELLNYRELLFFLVWRDIKVRYKQTFLGALWAVLQPVMTMVVFTVIFNRMAGIQADGVPYPVFSLAGLLPWTFFSQGLTQASNSLVGSSHLLTKIYFPRVLIPTASVLSGAVDLVISFVVLAGMAMIYGMRPSPAALALPLALVLGFLTTLAGGLWLSALNVRYRDVRYLVPFTVQLLLFVSPVIYPASDVVGRLEGAGFPGWIYGLNPMVGVVEGFRWSVLGVGPAPQSLLMTSAVVACCGVATGLLYFRRMERSFADIV